MDRTFGDGINDIGKVILLSNGGDGKQIETIYIFNGIDKDVPELIINKPENISYEEFKSSINDFLLKIGAKLSNRRDRWIKVTRVNDFDIDFDEFDIKYEKANKKGDQNKLEVPMVRQEVTSYDDTSSFSEEDSKRVLRENLDVIKNKLESDNSESKTNETKAENEKTAKEKNVRKYKIKSISDIYSHAKKPAFWAATDALVTGVSGIITVSLFSASHPVLGICGAMATLVALNKTRLNFINIKFSKIKENLVNYITERKDGIVGDAKSGLNDLKNSIIDKGVEQVENHGRSK